MKAETTFSLKDQLFNAEKVDFLAGQFKKAARGFPRAAFCAQVVEAFPQLELKERIVHITEVLRDTLPDDYPSALDTILAALPERLDPTKTDDDFGDFIIAPLSHYVARYGCERRHLDASLAALREITQRFSAEDAIRYFINAFPEETLDFLSDCTRDDNYHVRRLASEGTRPKLPWSQKLTIDYRQPLSILDALHRDPTRYVTRSVANHLNDISKLDAGLTIDTLRRWNDSSSAKTAASDAAPGYELSFVTKHALRTLIKQGHPDAMNLLGFSPNPDVTVTSLETSTPTVVVGESFEFELRLRSNVDQPLLIDYEMQFAGNATNGRTAGRTAGRKVFKLKMIEAAADEEVRVSKRHPMKLMTTRRLYEGTHTIWVQINGKVMAELSFELVAP